MRANDSTHQLLRRQSTVDPHQGWRRLGCLRAIRRTRCASCFDSTPWLHVSASQGQPGVDLDRLVPAVSDRWAISLHIYARDAPTNYQCHNFPVVSLFAEIVYNPITNYLLAGWSAVPEEKASRYRLSIKDVQPQDSGTYTCASPRGLTNSIIIVVAGNPSSIDNELWWLIESLCFLRQSHNVRHWQSPTFHYH